MADAVRGGPAVDTARADAGSSSGVGVNPSGQRSAPAAAEFDGWKSEAFAALAEQQLGELGKLVLGKSGNVAPGDLLSDDVRFDELRPSGLQTVFNDSFVEVRRKSPGHRNSASSQYSGPANLSKAIDAWGGLFRGAGDAHVKFKTVDVQLENAPSVSTRHFVSLDARTDAAVIEAHAAWRVEWDWPAERDTPRIKSIHVEDYEETRTPHRGVLFADCTASVLKNDASYAEQLQYGTAYWRSRIQGHFDFHQFGHNGISVGDVNGDGREDLYCCQPGGLPNRLYLQKADGTTVEVSRSWNVDYLDNTRSALLVDLDNDGDQDLVLAQSLYVLVLENEGQRHFVERARIRVMHAFSLAAADYDHDSDLDIYAAVYFSEDNEADDIPLPVPYHDANNGGRNRLIRNDGKWQFGDATADVGLDQNNRRFSFAAAWVDFDLDGDLDLYVANDFGRNNLFRCERGKFEDVADAAHVEDAASGMSVAIADYDRDGDFDIYVSNMFSSAGSRVTRQTQFMPRASETDKRRFQYLSRGNSLFQNLGDGRFQDVSDTARVTLGRWSWGSQFVDLNNDGWEDLIVANGFVTGESIDDL